MIIKCTIHSSGAALARYMTVGTDTELATIHQVRGFGTLDLMEAFRSVDGMAAATKCNNPLFHVQVRTPNGEELTREQWEHVADRIGRKLGLADQPRAIAFHVKDGHEHMHIGWSRIDMETMKAKAVPFFKWRVKTLARQLEREMGLTQVRNERGPGEPKAANRAEFEQARRVGVEANILRQTIKDAWEHSDSGAGFVAALAEYDLKLARGNRRDFVVVYHGRDEGGEVALGQRLLGVKKAAVQERLADLDLATLPDAQQAHEMIVADRARAEAARPAPEASPRRESEKPREETSPPPAQQADVSREQIAGQARAAQEAARTRDSEQKRQRQAAERRENPPPVRLPPPVTRAAPANAAAPGLRQVIQDAWGRSNNGAELVAALDEQGLKVARGGGEKGDVVVAYQGRENGGEIALEKAVGVAKAAVQQKLADLAPATLPSAQKAREMMVADRAAQQREAVDRLQRARAVREAPAKAIDSAARAAAPVIKSVERGLGGALNALTGLVSGFGRYQQQEQEAREAPPPPPRAAPVSPLRAARDFLHRQDMAQPDTQTRAVAASNPAAASQELRDRLRRLGEEELKKGLGRHNDYERER